ncbi:MULTISPECIES: pyridoxine 5'-phosphate synthase [Candidatus Ichthyocystis]|uniref:Pyridoxine 5'-phosphate synthase n=1 Tax=Candidatus Ichthyocystis hellenicum TaxID=1561003 RepID=A0A0S4M889_9BURK|nr:MULTISPECIES: pyridoxine 5'-phosphate synthase [Ichthyocystis]CUT17604.1 Pyridoxine 5'-phosphate synthase [Candidatus Ichthyocystis hellenicum]
MIRKCLRLGVNIDHIATVRQLRLGSVPSPVRMALLAEESGADQITCHLREDRRHIQEDDVVSLRKSIKTSLNVETSLDPDILSFLAKIGPDSLCLVPERREELTTEGGLDVIQNEFRLSSVVSSFRKKGVRVSIFIDPDFSQLDAAARLFVDSVEFNTGLYSNSLTSEMREERINQLISAGNYAEGLGLIVNAGHGLDYKNVLPILSIPGLVELNIGYAIVVYALDVGWANAVSRMKQILCN